MAAAVAPVAFAGVVVVGLAAAWANGDVRGAALAVAGLGAAATALATWLAARVSAGALVAREREIAIELDRSRGELRRALARVGDTLSSTHDRERIVEVVLETAAALTGARAAVFWSSAGRNLRRRAAFELSAFEQPADGQPGDEQPGDEQPGDEQPADEQQRGSEVPGGAERGGPGAVLQREQGVAGHAAAVERPALWRADRPGVAPGAASPPEPVATTAVAVPVRSQGRLFGVLALYDRLDGGPFDDDHVEDVAAVARQAEAAIDNTFLHEEAARLSITDGLTGLWNRRHFELRCREELERANRFGHPFGVVVLDIDDFKEINDVHGHLVGDAVLVELSRRLTTSTREVDVVARYGGEEFVLVLPRTRLAGATFLAEKVRRAVGDTPFEVEGFGAVPVTVSVGVAAHPDQGGTVRELLAAADAALYRAKGAGKDRVETAPAGGEGAATDTKEQSAT